MARIVSELQFVGPLGEFSAYRMQGQDKIIIRRKGGASKSKIKKSPAFEKTRKLNVEFGGRATATKWLMRSFWPMKAMADYNIAGPLNALLKPIQALDTYARFGQRHIELSKNPKLLEGFLFNKITPFDTTLRAPVLHTMSREDLTARVEIPALVPGINFHPAQRQTIYKIIVTLGVMPDLYSDMSKYRSHAKYSNIPCREVSSEWLPVNKTSTTTTLEIRLDEVLPDNNYSLVLAIGICYGTLENATTIEQVKRAGCAKVLGMV